MKELNIKDFFQQQYKPYTNYDNARSIPNLIDGLKISQRKILHTCVEKNINYEYKVAQLGSLTANFTEYHHGEQGLSNVISNIAQTFVGSNNLNFLDPIGQFGSRLSPIPASPRYIFTKLSKNFRTIFKKEDDIIIEYNYEDDAKIEPKFFIPILPGILLNSSKGIGTGFASHILARDHEELTKYIKAKLNNKSVARYKLLPYFKGFKGTVSHVEDTKYKIQGCFSRISATQIKITELPIDMYLDDIKKQLNKLIDNNVIKDYDDNSTEESFDIDVFFQRGMLSNLDDEDIFTKFKLVTTITENLTCWLDTGKLKKFKDVREIIDYFIDFRLKKYSDRIVRLLEIVEIDIKVLSNKIRFIKFYLNNVDKFKNSGKLQLLEILHEELFDVSMLELRIYNLTKDKILEHENTLTSLLQQKSDLLVTTNLDLYLKELT